MKTVKIGRSDSSTDTIPAHRPAERAKEKLLTILHFNDVYNIEARNQEPCGGAARFVTKVKTCPRSLHLTDRTTNILV